MDADISEESKIYLGACVIYMHSEMCTYVFVQRLAATCTPI